MLKFDSITIDPDLTGRELNLIFYYFICRTLPDYSRWLSGGGHWEIKHLSILRKGDRIMIDSHKGDAVVTIMDVTLDWIKRDIKLTEPGRYRTWLKKGHL